jgi:hypothetical protein
MRIPTLITNRSLPRWIFVLDGEIVKVWHHASADKLFCEDIDVGEESGPREIASGLREYYTLEDMQDRLVLVGLQSQSCQDSWI